MYAEHITIETDQAGKFKELPKLPPNKLFEIIVLGNVNKCMKRIPHPDIIGKIKITGDIFDSIPLSDWNL
ncbi:MAG: hypothetical protein IMF12_07440 [Proteobacteria bacterium]|nr:hypothetical protein [Pseudomonadota bacterium]